MSPVSVIGVNMERAVAGACLSEKWSILLKLLIRLLLKLPLSVGKGERCNPKFLGVLLQSKTYNKRSCLKVFITIRIINTNSSAALFFT